MTKSSLIGPQFSLDLHNNIGCARCLIRVRIRYISFQCSHSCGHGLQTRTVSCHRVNQYGWEDPETTDLTRCSNSQMPLEVRSCDLARCSSDVFWVVGDWAPCQWRGQCGTRGRQSRSVRCVNKAGRRVSRRKCKAEHANTLRPHRRRKCARRLCGYTSCKDVREVGAGSVNY